MAVPQNIGVMSNLSVQDSTVLTRKDFGRCSSLEIACTAAGLTGTNTLQSNENEDGSGTWVTVQSPPGTDITFTALKAIVLLGVPYMALRVHSSVVNEGGTKNFVVTGQIQA